MKKYIYILVSAFIILVVIVIKFPSLTCSSNAVNAKIEEPDEVKYSKEIQEVLSKFDSLFMANNQESGAIGGAVVITYKGQIVMTKCYGVKKAGENSPIDENTVFRLASVSKTISGVLAGILASEKEINLDDKVVDYLPDFKLKLSESTNSLTIRNLLSHTSGLIPHAFDIMVEGKVPLDQIIPRLNEVEITSAPGLVYAYQNVMFSVFDPIINAKTKKSLKSILREKVFEPFGMKNASADFESFQKNKNKAFPHQKTEKGFTSVGLNDRYYSTVPAAGINASISDMGRFLIAISQNNSTLFSKEARKIVFTPQIESLLKRSYYHNWGQIGPKYYAIGWRIINYKDHTIAHHGGYVAGYQSEIAVCDEEEIGIAVLTNSPNNYFSESVPAFLKLFFEFKNKQRQERIAEQNTPVSAP